MALYRSAATLTCLMFSWACTVALTPAHAQQPKEYPPPLSPAESEARFQVAEGLSIKLVAAEPQVAQPLSISFDDRGRMWVLEYRQYPLPNGLTAVQMDEWLRTKYDRIPEPPPEGPKGQDRISIHEDTDGDGRTDKITHFVDDLNLASGMALGDDGVYVVQPPYLLFYADRNRDDQPDGPPRVLLKGFGMDDAHAFANSLTWGPDGWLYGVQGSTSTADIRGIGFQQGIWRYHPPTDRFELFAEGGGNSWGVEFDQYGNVFALGNTVEPLVHHVQGAYYVKGFGKHGPLHNPHAYGYFLPVQHHGYLGDSLTGGGIIYQGGAFPERFHHALIAPNTRHSACRWSTLEPRGSTFATRAAGDFLTTDDIWFRPVDSTVGPDGALYIADWYDYNISHSSPQNRSEWYEPSRRDGRIWRVAPPDVAPVATPSMDLSRLTSAELIELLDHKNNWYVRKALRLLGERRDRSVTDTLIARIEGESDPVRALRALWALHLVGGLDEAQALAALSSHHEYVRAWTVRLLGDERSISPALRQRFVELARHDTSVIVRSQLACTAKRLSAGDALAIVAPLLERDEDAEDPHVPLLLWWAIEDKALVDVDGVLSLFASDERSRRPIVQAYLLERVARRYAAENSEVGYAACARLLVGRPPEQRSSIIRGMLAALSGQQLEAPPSQLAAQLAPSGHVETADVTELALALRLNLEGAGPAVLAAVQDEARPAADRATLVQTLGETRTPNAPEVLLALLGSSEPAEIQLAALAALGYFTDERIASALVERYEQLAPACQVRTIEVLCGRRPWAAKLLGGIEANRISPADVPLEQVRRLRELADASMTEGIVRYWGVVQVATPLEKQGRITAISQILSRGSGDPVRGREVFARVCANCHKLFGEGNSVGPDLTGAERKNRDLLLRNIVDPSAMIRPQFITHVVTTLDGRVLTGLLADSTDDTLTLLTAKNERMVLRRSEVEEIQESPVSLMPDNLLDELTDQQIRDLLALLQSDSAP